MARLIEQFKPLIDESQSTQGNRIGVFCPYTAEELVDAAGFQPFRLKPKWTDIRRADAYLPSNFCSYLRHIVDIGLADGLRGFRCVVFNHSCDGARRAHDVFSTYLGGISTVFVDIPKKKDEYSVQYYTAQLRKFRTFLEELRGKPIPDDALSASVVRYNHNRELLRRLYGLMAGDRLPLSTEELVQVLDLNVTLPKEQANTLLEEICAEADTSKTGKIAGKGERRVFLSGNTLDVLPLLGFIEECGARVVGDDFCFGGRYGRVEIAETGDPVQALAEGYLSRVPCGRMENYRERFDFLIDEMNRSNARGLIYVSLKFCDNFLIDYPSLKKLLDAHGIPSLFLEGEYFSFRGGQVRTRVEAFLEML